MNNTLEGINSRLDKAQDQMSYLKDKVEKKHMTKVAKEKEPFKK